MELVTLSLAAVTLFLIFLYISKDDGLSAIPGPFRMPLFGNVQCQFKRLHMQFTEWAQTYGDVFRIQILSQPAIVLNSYEAVKEAYVHRGKDFAGRPQMLRFQVIGANKGVAFRQHSDKQQKLRQRAQKAVAIQGTKLDHLISEHIHELVELIRAQDGNSFNPKILVKKFLINIIITMIFGEKCDFDDPLLDGIIEFNQAGVEAATIGHEDTDVWTWTKFFNPNYKLSVKARESFVKNVIPLYQKYKDTYIPDHERGVIDTYIADVLSGDLDDDVVHGVLIDYFIGGVETTATTLYGFLLTLLHYPKVQQKLQSDIDEVVGKDRHTCLSDRSSLPYAEACILELFRYQSTLPILIPRESLVDTEVGGYKIPKGTWVYANTWAIHHNEEIYSEPMKYQPERFLDSEGGILPANHERRKHLVTFGLGSRHCIGENLAKNRIFLALCSLMQNFTFVADELNPPPSADARHYQLKIIFDINDYQLRALPRL